MKLTYLSIVVICLCFLSNDLMYAQHWKAGIKSGLAISSLSQKEDNIYADGFESNSAIEVGIFTEYKLNTNWSVQLEALYTRRGGTRDGLQPIPPDDIPVELSGALPQGVIPYANFKSESNPTYIEIPVLAKYTFGNDWKFYVNAGPYIGFLTEAKQETSGNSTIYLDPAGQVPLQIPTPGDPITVTSSFDQETDVKDRLESTNFGIHAGIGVIRKLNEKHELFLDIRGSKGFIPIQKSEVVGQTTIGGLVFSIGYAYNFLKKNKT